MAAIIGDDGYSDEDLDALGSDDFLELQEQALQATQHRDIQHRLQPSLLRGQPISQSEIDQVTKEQPPEFHPVLHARGPGGSDRVPSHPIAKSYLPADHGPRRPQNGPSEATQREQWRLQRYGPSKTAAAATKAPKHDTSLQKDLPHRHPSQDVSYEGQGQPSGIERGPERLPNPARLTTTELPRGQDDLQIAMKQLILENERLLSEKNLLEQSIKTNKDQLLGKNGEIAILRSNHAKQLQDREKVLNDLKNHQRAQDEHHRTEIEQMRKEKDRLTTQNRFLDHENSERAWRPKLSKKPTKPAGASDTASTPRRPKGVDFGDGFEDNELESVSPSKVTTKPKTGTPKAGGKRKRDVLNLSPAAYSELQNEFEETVAEMKPSPPIQIHQSISGPISVRGSRAEFLHKLLYHRVKPKEARVFETMASFYFPAQPNVSLAEHFMDKAPPSDISDDQDDVPATFGVVLLDLWSRCLTERYYIPIAALINLLRFVLLRGTAATAVHLMDELVSLCQRTADINIIPRFKKLNKNAKVISVHLHDQDLESSEYIDTQNCLQLLQMTATMCCLDHDATMRFWHCMRFDFISMVLRVVQPIEDIILMVRLLYTCVEQDMFAAIKPQSQDGGSAEQHVIDRLSSMLIEVPRPLHDDDSYDIMDVLKLRLVILGLMELMCEQQLCSRALATHPLALGRLVRIMNDELNAIYANPYALDSRSEIINRVLRILFHLTTAYPAVVELQEKLRRQPGGVNKFLITLSRLAFSDAVWYERGISEDAFDCAHQLLEDFVTPEEAEALKKAFVRDEV